MKKSEFTQLTLIIEHMVAREVKKQLPTIMTEVFQNMMGKQVVTEIKQSTKPILEESMMDEQSDFNTSLKELFSKSPPTRVSQEDPIQIVEQHQTKFYTKDPKINAILNETTSDLRQRERLVGAAAFQGGYSPSLSMVPGFDPSSEQSIMPSSEEPSFSRNIPTIPIKRPPVLREGQESNHVPLSELPEGSSVLDVVSHIPAPAAVKQALTKNYSQMMKLIDKKKSGKI